MFQQFVELLDLEKTAERFPVAMEAMEAMEVAEVARAVEREAADVAEIS